MFIKQLIIRDPPEMAEEDMLPKEHYHSIFT